MINKNKKDDYMILFGGAKITKRQGNCVGLGMIFGILGIWISFLLKIENPLFGKSTVIIFAIIGYFIGCKLFTGL